MTIRRFTTGMLILLAVSAACYASFRFGAAHAVGRGAYVASIPIRQEQACFTSGDIECLRVHWRLRASIVAESSRRSLQGPFPSSAEAELRSYIHWEEQLGPYTPPAK
jgi:hypothetical protein